MIMLNAKKPMTLIHACPGNVVDFDHSTIHLSDQQITAYLTRRKYSAFKNAYLLYLESMR